MPLAEVHIVFNIDGLSNGMFPPMYYLLDWMTTPTTQPVSPNPIVPKRSPYDAVQLPASLTVLQT